MRAVESIVFHLMMFPHDGNIVMVDQLTYHDPQGPTAPVTVIPTVDTSFDNAPTPSLLALSPQLLTYTSMTNYFSFFPPPLAPSKTMDLCMLSSSTITPKLHLQSQPHSYPQPHIQPQPQPQSLHNYWDSFPIYTILFLFPFPTIQDRE